jgi:hypothetical protein
VNDRVAIGHKPEWDVDLAYGQQGELVVLDMIKAIANGTVRCEIKRDRGFLKSGRLYIEHEQNARNRGIWKPSGILTSTAQAWAFLVNNGQGLIVVDTPWLKRAVARAAEHPSNHASERDGDNPTRGVCIELNHLKISRQP